eukprot:TRINITY_DN113723_c0_g1_i1.p1 TRINITY_DN113723_c0_g1~~TRINITY_DN113723_c0_g1_i1.p1  ORF type:complete len:239 (+),score=66.33 TRINITY_DN113723_c0_g1_i1:124-840(+)
MSADAAVDANKPRLDLKVVLLGDSSVGKTCLAHRWIEGEFRPFIPATTGAQFRYLQYFAGERLIACGLWDLAGQSRFDSLQSFYCRNAKGAIVCYDVTNRESFESVQGWIDKVRRDGEEDCVITVVGTKLDLAKGRSSAREVPFDEGKRLATANDALFFETSAREGTKIVDVFERLVERYVTAQQLKMGEKPDRKAKIERRSPKMPKTEADPLLVGEPQKESSTCCCECCAKCSCVIL